MTDLAQMKTLMLVSERGSLAAAARELGISSAAVSKQLSRLETELGLQLLTRSTRHVALTEAGKDYCEQCKRIFEEVDEAAALISQMKAAPQGLLRVVSGRHFANSYILPRLKGFLHKYPEIRLHLELAERMPDLHLEAIDVLAGMNITAQGDVLQKRMGTTRYCYCASSAYLQEFGHPQKPSDLLAHRYITHTMRRPANELLFPHGEKLAIQPYLSINDAETMLYLAQQGLGIVKLHHYMVEKRFQEGTLVELLAAYSEKNVPLYVALPPRRYTPAKVRCFLDFLEESMQHPLPAA